MLITHFHHDHTEGIKGLREHFGDKLRVWKMPWAPGVLVPWTKVEYGPKTFNLEDPAMGVRMLADGDVLTTEAGDASLRALHTPGHTVDHCCFVLQEEGALFSGDHVLGGSSSVFEDLHAYMASLDKALAVLPRGAGGRIYPGHGPVIADGHQGVLDYLANRRQREKQVVDALQGRSGGISPYGLARLIYPQVSFALRLAAASNVERTLLKLQKEGRATCWALSPFPFKVCGVQVDAALLTLWWWVE